MNSKLIQRFGLTALMVGGLALSGCGTQTASTPGSPDAAAFGPGEAMVETDLYFGQGLPGGGSITAQQWTDFVSQVITPRFPDGLTILSAQGQWRDASGHIEKENTMEVIIIHPAAANLDKAIEEIRDLYKKKFNQESVLRSSHPVRASF